MDETALSEMSTIDQYVVRRATYSDLPEIARIARVTWEATYNETIAPENRREFLERAYKPENLADGIDAPDHWFYVVETEGKMVGFGHFLRRYHPTRGRAELVRLYILPEYQNRGIGAALLKTGFKALSKAGIEQCFVSVQSTNQGARRFYERHGFTYHRTHGQFLGTQIVTLVEYIRDITQTDTVQ
ncbi:MAG: GNAT family N-acetyltransferase [Chloroflexi bacterium]|nr:MAG: GNAT family N-acetyltransferase [Chloroflexota bacterium]